MVKKGRMIREKKLASVKLPLFLRGTLLRRRVINRGGVVCYVDLIHPSPRLAEILDRLDRGPSTVTVAGNSPLGGFAATMRRHVKNPSGTCFTICRRA